MAQINITNVVVYNNPTMFSTPFKFEITFESLKHFNDYLEWKMLYVGSADSEDYDQTLDHVACGPVPKGSHMFVFEADPPDINKLPKDDILGVTVVLLIGSYRNKEFVRVGYYLNIFYQDMNLRENPPAEPIVSKLHRHMLATAPRVTTFKIDWGDDEGGSNENLPPALPEDCESNSTDSSNSNSTSAGQSNSNSPISNDKLQNSNSVDEEMQNLFI